MSPSQQPAQVTGPQCTRTPPGVAPISSNGNGSRHDANKSAAAITLGTCAAVCRCLVIPLPIDTLLPQLMQELSKANAVVLEAPPGAGKTTRVPPALLDQRLAGDKEII